MPVVRYDFVSGGLDELAAGLRAAAWAATQADIATAELVSNIGDLKKGYAALAPAIDQSTKALDKSTKKSKEAKDQGHRLRNGLEAAKQAAEGFGGSLGGAAGMVEKFARAGLEAEGAIGPLGIAAAGAAIGATALVAATVKGTAALLSWIDSANDAVERTRALDAAFGALEDRDEAALDSFASTLDVVRAAGERLSVLLASDLARHLEDNIRVAGKLALVAIDLAGSLGEVANFVRMMAGGIGYAEGYVAALDKALSSYDDELDQTIGLTKSATQAHDDFMASLANVRAAREATEAQREFNESVAEGKAAWAEQQKALAELKAEEEAWAADRMAAAAEVNDFLRDEARLFKDIRKAEAEANEAREEALKLTQEQAEADAAAQREWLAGLDAIDARQAEIDDAERQRIRDRTEAQAQAILQVGAAFANLGETLTQQAMERHEDNLEELRDQREILKSRKNLSDDQKEYLKVIKAQIEVEKEAAMKAFKRNKAIQVAAAIANAASAALALLGSPGIAILGPGAPWAVAGIVGAELSAALANIAATKPPEFPGGRPAASADHPITAAVRPDERILSPRETAALDRAGGPEALARPQQITLRVGTRVIADAFADAMSAGIVDLSPRGGIIGRVPLYGGARG